MYTLENLYPPNKNHVSFLETILEKLQDFVEGSVIMGGEFNFTLDPIPDASRSSSHLFLLGS